MNTPHLHSFVDGQLGCSCLLFLVSNVAVNIGVTSDCKSLLPLLLGYMYLEVELLDHMVTLIFPGTPHCFPQRPPHFTFPLTVHKGSGFCTSLPMLVIFFVNGHLNGCEVASRGLPHWHFMLRSLG